MSWEDKMLNHALVLLEYVYRHPDEYQSYRVLSERLGIPLSTLHYMLNYSRRNGEEHDMFLATASRYGYLVRFVRKPGRILFVMKVALPVQNERWYYDEDMVRYVRY